MYEEDRQAALAMYVKMFDDAEDEQALIQALSSPTRQAVIVARAYNAKERKLQVEAQTREETGEELETEGTPDFMLAIHQVYEDSVPTAGAPDAPMADQFSLFEDGPRDEEEPVLSEEALEGAAEAALDAAEAELAAEPAAAQPPLAEAAAPAEDSVTEAEEPARQASAAPVIPLVIPAAQEEAVQAEAQEAGEAPLPAAEEPSAEAAAQETPAPAAEPAAGEADQVEQFLADFSIPAQELAPMPTMETAPPGLVPDLAQLDALRAPAAGGFDGFAPILDPSLAFETAPAGMTPVGAVPAQPVTPVAPAAPVEAAQQEPTPPAEEAAQEEAGEQAVQPGGRRLRPLILILFLLAAIPVTLLGVALLLIPTLFFLALGAGILSGGVAVVLSAFSGFPVFADIMLLLGAALILLALGLLCLWTFVWFVGAGIVGLIRSVIALGSRWCYKEVSQ